MSSPYHSRVFAVLLALVPGWGHVYLGRDFIGLTLFSLSALLGFLVFNAYLMMGGEYRMVVIRCGLALHLMVSLFSLLDVWRRTSPRRLNRIEEKMAGLLRDGMISYLRDELGEAENAFRTCLKLDNQEVEALVRLGVVLARKGFHRPARRILRRARSLDLEEKWNWEIERELQALREKPGAPSEPDVASRVELRKAGEAGKAESRSAKEQKEEDGHLQGSRR